MGDKADKPKKKTPKRKAQDKGVMSALPSTRPERIGTRRQAAKAPPAPKPRPAARRKPPAGVTSGRPKAAAPRTFEPTRAAEAAAAGEGGPEPARAGAGGLVGSALHVAGEVAQAGLTLGGRFVKGTVGRLPRP